MPPLQPQAIEDMTVADLFTPDELWRSSRVRPVLLPERIERIRDDVAKGQNRFRMVYGTCVSLEETQDGVDCPHKGEDHFHRRVRRIGHLPMFTIRELPE